MIAGLRGLAVWLVCLAAVPAGAEPMLPALYDVTGVAKGDVLNLRAAPSAKAAILASLLPNAKGVEVIGISADGRWAQVSSGESVGYASLRFLKQQSGPDWTTLKINLRCVGAEPFWGLAIAGGGAAFTSPDAPEQKLKITNRWQGTDWDRNAALSLEGATGQQAFAIIRGEECSDGMSDRGFGLSVEMFLSGKTGNQTLRGCCSLAP